MANSRSFDFQVDEQLDTPLWVQLKNRMVFLIEQGFFAPGEKLPTVRGLAVDLGINYNTVNKVYLSLAADGYIESSRGRGAFVLETPQGSDGSSGAEFDELMDDFVGACLALGLSYDDIGMGVSRKLGKLKYEHEREKTGGGRLISMDEARGKAAKRAGGYA